MSYRTQNLTLVQGDDYNALDSRGIVYSLTGLALPDLSSATWSMDFDLASTGALIVTAAPTVTYTAAAGSTPASVTVDIDAATTALFTVGASTVKYDLHATNAGRRITVARGVITVVEDIGV